MAGLVTAESLRCSSPPPSKRDKPKRTPKSTRPESEILNFNLFSQHVVHDSTSAYLLVHLPSLVLRSRFIEKSGASLQRSLSEVDCFQTALGSFAPGRIFRELLLRVIPPLTDNIPGLCPGSERSIQGVNVVAIK